MSNPNSVKPPADLHGSYGIITSEVYQSNDCKSSIYQQPLPSYLKTHPEDSLYNTLIGSSMKVGREGVLESSAGGIAFKYPLPPEIKEEAIKTKIFFDKGSKLCKFGKLEESLKYEEEEEEKKEIKNEKNANNEKIEDYEKIENFEKGPNLNNLEISMVPELIENEEPELNEDLRRKLILNEVISKMETFFEKEKKSDFIEIIKKISEIQKKEKNKILLVGPCFSGKTTLANLILSYDPENYSFSKDYIDVLPVSAGNVSNINWRIEESEDSNIMSLMINDEEKVYNLDKLPDFKAKLKEISEEKTDNYKEILIKLPLKNLKNFSIIDNAGLKEENLKFLKEKHHKQICCWVYVKSMSDSEKIEENLIKLFDNHNQGEINLPSISLVFTKKDQFCSVDSQEIESNDEENRKKTNIEKDNIRHRVKNIVNIDNISFFNLLNVDHDLQEFQGFYKELRNALNIFKINKTQYIFDNLKSLWNNYIEKLKEKQEKLDSDQNKLYVQKEIQEITDFIEKDANWNDFFNKLSTPEYFNQNFPKDTLTIISD